jgi:hypothetical protein
VRFNGGMPLFWSGSVLEACTCCTSIAKVVCDYLLFCSGSVLEACTCCTACLRPRSTDIHTYSCAIIAWLHDCAAPDCAQSTLADNVCAEEGQSSCDL